MLSGANSCQTSEISDKNPPASNNPEAKIDKMRNAPLWWMGKVVIKSAHGCTEFRK